MNLMQMLAGMQGQGGQGQAPQMPQSLADLQGNPMATALFGNMPFMSLPQPQGPGPMPMGRFAPEQQQQPAPQQETGPGAFGLTQMQGSNLFQNNVGQQFRERPSWAGGSKYMPARDYQNRFGK